MCLVGMHTDLCHPAGCLVAYGKRLQLVYSKSVAFAVRAVTRAPSPQLLATGEDGTPHESLEDVLVRVRQVRVPQLFHVSLAVHIIFACKSEHAHGKQLQCNPHVGPWQACLSEGLVILCFSSQAASGV